MSIEENQIERLSQEVAHIQGDVKEIKDALLGNEFNKGKGWSHTLSSHDTRITSIEKRLDKAMYWLMGASAGSGVALYKLFESFITKQ